MQGEWREVEWTDGRYIVHRDGRLARVLDLTTDVRGYKATTIRDWDGHRKKVYIHHLVAEAFLPEPPGETGRRHDQWQLHHRSGDKSDNGAENLVWVRRATHDRLSLENGQKAHGEGHGQSKLTADDVREARRRYYDGGVTQAELAEEYGVSQPTIGCMLRRETWQHVE